MSRFTQAEKQSAKNALDYQTRTLDVAKKTWQEEWVAAANPFAALIQWKANKSIRDTFYGPWLLAKKQADLCGPPAK